MDTCIKTIQLDKLALVVNLGEDFQHSLTSKLYTLQKEKKTFRHNISGYKNGFRIPVGGKDSIANEYLDINSNPYKRKKDQHQHQALIEFIPSRFTENGLLELVDYIENLFEIEYKDFVELAPITRADIAFDIANLTPDDVLFSYPSKTKWGTCGKGNTIESVYFGDWATCHRFRIYNKSLQMREMHRPGAAAFENDTMRLELCLKPNIPLRKIRRLLDKIPPVTMYSVKKIREETDIPLCFLDSCRLRTIPGALSLLDHDQANIYKEYFKACRLDCFEEKAIRKLFQQHLQSLAPLRPGKLSDVDSASPHLGTIMDGKGTFIF